MTIRFDACYRAIGEPPLVLSVSALHRNRIWPGTCPIPPGATPAEAAATSVGLFRPHGHAARQHPRAKRDVDILFVVDNFRPSMSPEAAAAAGYPPSATVQTEIDKERIRPITSVSSGTDIGAGSNTAFPARQPGTFRAAKPNKGATTARCRSKFARAVNQNRVVGRRQSACTTLCPTEAGASQRRSVPKKVRCHQRAEQRISSSATFKCIADRRRRLRSGVSAPKPPSARSTNHSTGNAALRQNSRCSR